MHTRGKITLVAVGIAAAGVVFGAATYCNPLSLPDYSRGTFAQADDFQAQLGASELVSKNGPYREAGDPAVIVEKGVWYMYASGVMSGCWKSADRGATWQRIDNGLPPFALGYAPTIVKFRGKFLVCGGWGAKAGSGALYRADSPEGPFAFVGRLKPPRNDGAPNCADPMLFADGDRLYFYWGCTPDKGIWGCELDPDDPLKALTPAKRLVAYDPEHQPWERFPNRPFGFVEGAWMFKRNGGYYLMFSAGGTEFPTYATGIARGTSPLGEFVLQKNNPVFFSPSGVVTGTAHGSVIRDDQDDWWYFYTVHASIRHRFERRIGMDRLTFDANGDVVARSASSDPQPLSGAFPDGRPWRAIEGVCYSAGAAFDRSLRTEFVPVKLPYEVEFEFLKTEDVRANRVIWSADGPVGYRIELKGKDGKWTTVLDATKAETDLLVDYRELAKTSAVAARLTVVSAPKDALPRLVEWTIFADTPFDSYVGTILDGHEMKDESVLFVGARDSAPLLFRPNAIRSVTSYDGVTTYVEGRDWAYDRESNRLRRTEGSRMPFFAEDDIYLKEPRPGFQTAEGSVVGRMLLRGGDGATFLSNQVVVAYSHADVWDGPRPNDASDAFAPVLGRFCDGREATVVFYGDSITFGWSSSKLVGVPPHRPPWAEQVFAEIRRRTGNTRLRYVNAAVSGMGSNWGITHIRDRVTMHRPALAVLAFGMNDEFVPTTYRSYAKRMVDAIRAESPGCAVLLVSCMVPNGEVRYYHDRNSVEKKAQYEKELVALVADYRRKGVTDVGLANVNTIYAAILAKKRFLDMSSNHVNHCNDFAGRIYAEVVLSALFGTVRD